MPTAGALVDVAAQRGGAATDDGGQDLQVQPGEPISAALVERRFRCADQIGHLQRWPRHLFDAERESVQRAGSSRHMAFGKMNVDHRFPQVGMAQQQLDGAQVGAGLEQMSSEAMAPIPGPE